MPNEAHERNTVLTKTLASHSIQEKLKRLNFCPGLLPPALTSATQTSVGRTSSAPSNKIIYVPLVETGSEEL